MKKSIFFHTMLFISLFLNENIPAQTTCKVLNESINQTYEGKCKNGLAHGKGIAKGIETYEGNFKNGLPHGKGTYRYQDGSIYTGGWKNGLRHGEAKLTTVFNNQSTITEGIWEQDDYVGKKELPPYQIKNKKNVDRFSMVKQQSPKQRVLIQFYQNGTINNTISNLLLQNNNGIQIHMNNYSGYENIQFPFKCTLSYDTSSRLNATSISVIFEFIINEPGDWRLVLHN